MNMNHNQRPPSGSSRSSTIWFMLAQRPCSAHQPAPANKPPSSSADANDTARSHAASMMRTSVGARASASRGSIGIR